MSLREIYKKESMEQFVILPKCETIDDYNDSDFYNLAMIKVQSNGFYDYIKTSIVSTLEYQMMSAKNTESKESMKESFTRLMNDGYINVYENQQMTKIAKELKPSKDYFITINDKSSYAKDDVRVAYAKIFYSDLRRIVETRTNYKQKLFAVYHAIIGCVFYDGKNDDGSITVKQCDRLSYPSIEFIAKRTGLDRKTVINCIKILHENEIIYSVTATTNSDKKNNFYCRWMYKDYAKEWVRNHFKNAKDLIIEEEISE